MRTYGLLYYDDNIERWVIHFAGKQNWFSKSEVEMELQKLIEAGVNPNRINRIRFLIPGYNFHPGGDE